MRPDKVRKTWLGRPRRGKKRTFPDTGMCAEREARWSWHLDAFWTRIPRGRASTTGFKASRFSFVTWPQKYRWFRAWRTVNLLVEMCAVWVRCTLSWCNALLLVMAMRCRNWTRSWWRLILRYSFQDSFLDVDNIGAFWLQRYLFMLLKKNRKRLHKWEWTCRRHGAGK